MVCVRSQVWIPFRAYFYINHEKGKMSMRFCLIFLCLSWKHLLRSCSITYKCHRIPSWKRVHGQKLLLFQFDIIKVECRHKTMFCLMWLIILVSNIFDKINPTWACNDCRIFISNWKVRHEIWFGWIQSDKHNKWNRSTVAQMAARSTRDWKIPSSNLAGFYETAPASIKMNTPCWITS